MRIIKIILTCFTIFAAQSITFAQEKNNLSFDKLDPQNGNMPRGWFKWGDFTNISGEKLGNQNNVGKVVSDNDGKLGCITYAVPLNYVGDTIMLTGRIKFEKVKNSVGLLMRIHGKSATQSLGFASMQPLKIKGTKDWAEYSIKLPLPSAANHVYIGGILNGDGIAWFDDFKVYIDGVNIEELKETPKAYLKDFDKDILKKAISESSTKLDLSTDEKLSLSLTSLVEKLSNKKIVSIGESTHGTSEFYKMRDIISRKLIQDHGFKVIVLENPYDEIEILNKNLLDTPLDTLMRKHLFSIYQTAEMKSFLEWYRDNRANYGIQFKGCDDSYWSFYELLEERTSDISNKNFQKLMKKLSENVAKSNSRSAKNGQKFNIAIYENIVEIESYLKSSNHLTEPIKDLLFNVKNSYINYVNIKNASSFQSRDEIMAARVSYLAKNNQNKIIVWAHNAHISNEVLYDNETGIMGRNLKKEFGSSYHSVGLSTLKGNYSYIEEKFIYGDNVFDEKLKSETIKPTETTFWESAFALNGAAFYLETASLTSKLKTDELLGTTKLIGYGIEKEDDVNYELFLLKHFDTILFLEDTTATTPLFN